MARGEARISVDVWGDEDWCSLSWDAQCAYMFLLSQRDLAHDGVIALRVRRWARAAADLTVERLEASLAELAERRFVVIDVDTEELLIRSLLRRDKIFRQPNVLRAAADHLPLVVSRTIRTALAVELTRIAGEDMPDTSRAILAEMKSALPEPPENPPSNPAGNPSPYPPPQGTGGTPGERGVVTVVSSASPYPVIPELRDPPSGGRRAQARARPRPATRIPDDFEPDADLTAWARTKAPATNRADHEAFVDYWRAQPGLRGTKVDWRATWRTWMRRAQADHERHRGNGARASPALVERAGLRLKPETAARLDDRARFEAMDRARAQPAIEGPDP